MRIALITDTHFGARSDSQVFSSYFEKFYSNVFFPTIDKEGIDTIIHLGDLVDRRKFINYISLSSMNRMFLQPLIQRNITTHFIVGNHDVPYKNTNEVSAGTELLNATNAPFHVYRECACIDLDGAKIVLIPWINNSNEEHSKQFIEKHASKASILLGHLEINGFRMYRNSILSDGISHSIFEGYDLVCSGHYHHRSNIGRIHYLGSPYEITWSDYNDTRGFHILDTETASLTFVRNPYRMFHKIVYNDEKQKHEDLVRGDYSYAKDHHVKLIIQKNTSPMTLDLTMEAIEAVGAAKVTIVHDNENMDELSDESIAVDVQDTLTILDNYIDGVSVSVNKKELKGLFHSLYNESQYIDV